MMHPMGGNPNQWSAFQAQGGAHREKMFDPSRHLIASVGEQAMVTHADSGIDSDDMKSGCDHHRGPAKTEERRDGSHVKEKHKAEDQPVH